MQHAQMRGIRRSEMNLVIRRGAKGVVARLEPFEAHERKPAVRFLQLAGMRGTPRGQLLLPRGSLGPCARCQQAAQRKTPKEFAPPLPSAHKRLYRDAKHVEKLPQLFGPPAPKIITAS